MNRLLAITISKEDISPIADFSDILEIKNFILSCVAVKVVELDEYISNFASVEYSLNYDKLSKYAEEIPPTPKSILDERSIALVVKSLVELVESTAMTIVHSYNVHSFKLNINFGFIDSYRVYLSVETV